MAQKPTDIVDIKSPGKVAPSVSSRPIVVTNRPAMAADPMMVSDQPKAESKAPAEPVNRSEKIIKPLDATLKAPSESTPAVEAPDAAAPENSEAAAASATKSETETKPDPETETSAEDDAAEPTPAGGVAADEAALAEAEAAKAAREQELEQLITSGKYAVPINAVGRKRSHMYIAVLCVLALVVAAVLLDVLLDAGIIKLGGLKPLTHFFGK